MNKKEKENIMFQINMIVWKYLSEDGRADLFRKYYEVKSEVVRDEDKLFVKRMKEEIIPLVIETIQLKIKIESIGKKWSEDILEEAIAGLKNAIDPSDEYIMEQRNKVDMGCPCCRTKLVFVKKGKYETLCEHVGNPNSRVSMKDAFGCPNTDCEAYKYDKLWIESGEGPYGGFKKIKYIDNNDAPFRTYHRSLNAQQSKKFDFFITKWIMIIIEISSKADNNGKRNWNKIIKIGIAFLDKHGGYVKYISGINMLIYNINKYIRRGDKRVDTFIFDIEHIEKFKYTDWWRKLSLAICSFIWKNDYKLARAKIEEK